MRRVALVFAGGFCGTLARYFLAAPLLTVAAAVFPGGRSGFPFDIFLINMSGALALGLLYGLFERGARISPEVRLAVGTGFLGAYTTFSTFAYGGQTLLTARATIVGVMYLIGSVALGVACARIGYRLAGPIVMRHRHVRRGLVRAGQAKRESRLPTWRTSACHGAADPECLREHEEQEVR
jgi:CrcB protein